MEKITRKQRSYIASVLKPKYKVDFDLKTHSGITDDKLYRWYYEKNKLTYIEGISKAEIVNFIYHTLRKKQCEQPKIKSVPKRIKYMNVILDKAHSEFYSTPDWLWLKKKMLKLYGCRCMRCAITNTEMHVDHIVPRSERRDLQLSPSNLQILCKACNMEKSNIHNTDYRTSQDKELLVKFLSK